MRRWLILVPSLLVLCVALVLALAREASELPPLEPRTRSAALRATDATPLGRAVAARAAAHPDLSGVKRLARARHAFAARVLLARAAERSIDAQYYIWRDDLTGALLFDELRAAADRGVRVRLLLDDNTTAGTDGALAALDAHPGIEVRLFNPFVVREPRFIGYLADFDRLNRRMHNKSFTVDNQATIIGGRNIGDEYFGAGDDALFVDLDALAVGPVVRGVSADFDRYWASASAYPAARILAPGPGVRRIAARAAEVRAEPAAARYLAAVRDLPFVSDLLAGRLSMHWAPVTMVSDDPAKGLGPVPRGGLLFPDLVRALGEPERRLDLVSGYFVPARDGTEALAAMARRGVDVRVVTNSFAATDVPVVHAGYAKRRRDLLRAGVRLFEMRAPAGAGPGRAVTGSGGSGSGGSGVQLSGAGEALHAKTFAVDGERLFIGSFNFDPRSAKLNTEIGFVIASPALAGGMEDGLDRFVPAATYEVRLGPDGGLRWIERVGGREVVHDIEPGTRWWQRALVTVLGWLPIDWLL